MKSSDPTRFIDDLLDFASEEEEEEEARNKKARRALTSSFTPTALGSALLTVLRPDDCSGPFADSPLIEEELEWISNKDAFPAVETFPGFLSSHHDDDVFLPAKQNSPVSVLENSSGPTTTNADSATSSSSGVGGSSIVANCCGGLPAPPGKKKARSRRGPPLQLQCSWYKHHGIYDSQAQTRQVPLRTLGRKCQHCGVEKTPQWRAGPSGAKTLCNACGVRYKSGRLMPEYRPANSPTFCSDLHSNSHRKVVEMRRQKEMIGGGLPVSE